MTRTLCLMFLVACSSVPPPQTANSQQSELDSGEALFAENCLRCHGEGYAPNLTRSRLTREAMREKVRHANSYAMPSFSVADLGDAQLELILDWVRPRS